MVPWNSASGGFAYIWQSKWVGIIAVKTKRTQIHFLSDVLVALASLDLKVPNNVCEARPISLFCAPNADSTDYRLAKCVSRPITRISRPCGFRNPRNFCLWNPESWALESGIQLKESRILLKIRIQNSSSTDTDLNPVPGNPESSSWNPESKTVLDPLIWGEISGLFRRLT